MSPYSNFLFKENCNIIYIIIIRNYILRIQTSTGRMKKQWFCDTGGTIFDNDQQATTAEI